MKENPILENLFILDSIQKRIEKFLGYGNIFSDIWFIGIEERFNGSKESLIERLKVTSKGSGIYDMRRDMKRVEDHMKWFKDDANMQDTWGRLIRILFNIDGDENVSLKNVKEYQRNNLGDKSENHCLLEFLPLPVKSGKKKDWIYNCFSIDYLKTRDDYQSKVIDYRIKFFKKIIKQFHPKIVIFYSGKEEFIKYWENIADCKFTKKDIGIDSRKSFSYCKNSETNFFIIDHPIAQPGIKNSDLNKIGKEVRKISAYEG